MDITHTHHYRHGYYVNRSSHRRSSSLAVDSYHRPSPTIPSLGMALGNPTKPVSKDHQKERPVQHDWHCMDYAISLYNQFKNGDL